MADKDYYAHQHSQSSINDDNIVLVSSLNTVVDGSGGVEHAREGVVRSVGSMFSDFKPPARRGRDSVDARLCQTEDCKAFRMKTLDYCTGHARSMGLIENWKKSGRDSV